MKILFIVPYPSEGPSNRYRVEQYLPYLKEIGAQYSLRPFISSDFFKILYKNSNRPKKFLYFLSATTKRLLDSIKCAKYDLIFIHIESLPFGPAILEWFYRKLGKPIIYDFEDAIYMSDFKGRGRIMNFLRYPNRFYQILGLSSHVIVCNKYMRNFVYPYNPNITVIPTSIDTEKFKVANSNYSNKKPVIGWIGSHTTAYCLKPLTRVFTELAKKYDFVLKIIGGSKDYSIPKVNVINEEWTLKKDVENFQSLDIGVYPLPNDERAMAKTPFKTVQYMSVGVASVVSRIGGNREIIQDGVNGFLVDTEDEWFEKLSLLIKNPELRKKIGLAGRMTVEDRYSIKMNAPKFLEVLQRVYSQNKLKNK